MLSLAQEVNHVHINRAASKRLSRDSVYRFLGVAVAAALPDPAQPTRDIIIQGVGHSRAWVMNSQHVETKHQSAVTPRRWLRIRPIAGAICIALTTFVTQAAAQTSDGAIPLDATTEHTIKTLYRNLIDAENRHDIHAVQPFVRNSCQDKLHTMDLP